MLPAASVASAVRVWEPLAYFFVSQTVVNGGAVSVAITVPSTLNRTASTPALSAAVAPTETRPRSLRAGGRLGDLHRGCGPVRGWRRVYVEASTSTAARFQCPVVGAVASRVTEVPAAGV